MKFYIDFEAAQFSEQIISIGCMDEMGKPFYSLVRPEGKVKISKFITELTGITKEDLLDENTADDVFLDFYDYIKESCARSNSPIPEFYCYGDSDAIFLKKTINHMTNTRSIIIAQSILATLTDYAVTVKNYFHSDNSIALKKVCSFMEDENIEQKHNALDDAKMLMYVEKKLTEKCKPEDRDEIRSLPGNVKPKVSLGKKAPEAFLKLEGTRWNATTGADENNYVFKCVHHTNEQMYFNDIDTAIMWCIKYVKNGASPKNAGQVNKTRINIEKALMRGSKYCGVKWVYKEE